MILQLLSRSMNPDNFLYIKKLQKKKTKNKKKDRFHLLYEMMYLCL